MDHVIPRSEGGSDDDSNLKVACFGCNQKLNTAFLAKKSIPGLMAKRAAALAKRAGAEAALAGPTLSKYNQRITEQALGKANRMLEEANKALETLETLETL